jgi:ribosomal protein S18 acetylase RimI-like enzyme
LCIQKQQDNLYVSRLGVKKGYSRKGYGTELILFALQKAKQYNKKKLTCKVHEDSWQFYQNMGFKKLREYNDPHWGKSALMELTLNY